MTATKAAPHRWRGKAEKVGGRGYGRLLGELENSQPLKMWKEQALASGKGKSRRLLPPQMTLYSHMMGRAGLTQQLVTGRQAQAGLNRGRPPGEQSPQAPTPQVFIVSRDCLESKRSTNLHREPPNPPGRAGQGFVIKAQNQTQTRPDQSSGAAAGPGLTSLCSTFLGLAQRSFSPGRPIFTKFDTQDCQDPTSKAGCHEEP